jgi:hypothetical protein
MIIKRSFLLFTILLLTGVSCKKDPKLSEFIIGKWASQEFILINSQTGDSRNGYFIITINTNNTCVVSQIISAGAQSFISPTAGYTITKGRDQIKLDQPILDPQVGTEFYNVLWKDGGNTMSWAPGDGTSTVSFLWTRQ